MISKQYIVSFICIAVLSITVNLYAQEDILPKIDINGKYHAISWVYSNMGERIDREHDLDLTIVYRKKRLTLNSVSYIVDNAVHQISNSGNDQYKAFWTDGGNLLVLELYVAEDGVFRKDKDGKPLKHVSSFYFSPDKSKFIWETNFPSGTTVTRTYIKLSSP